MIISQVNDSPKLTIVNFLPSIKTGKGNIIALNYIPRYVMVLVNTTL